jgi:hypothetical protein
VEVDELITRCAWQALCLGVLSGVAIYERVRAGRFLTGLSGVHVNVFMLYAIGLGCYLLEPVGHGEVLGFHERDHNYVWILAAISRVQPSMILGYALVVAWDVYRQRRSPPVLGAFERPDVSLWMLTVLGLLAVVGYSVAHEGENIAGSGTLLQLLANLLFPAVVLAIWVATLQRPLSVVLAVALLTFASVTGVFVQWRSQLVYSGLAVAIGFGLRSPRRPLMPVLAVALALLVLLPFANEKKIHYQEVSRDPVGAFVRTLDLSMSQRVAFLTRFWAIRINAAREMGFVAHAIDAGRVPLRYGVSYWEAVQQLVPRALWPEKPSFNTTMNVDFARDIGLVAKTNKKTAWGVNVFAEAVWNFGGWALALFVPLFALGVAAIDELFARRIRHPTLRWVLGGALFFLIFGGASLVQMVTYLMWMFLFGAAGDWLLSARDTQNRPRDLAAPST